jgi:hypothetical protein
MKQCPLFDRAGGEENRETKLAEISGEDRAQK